jgi:hypothetical protein
MCLGLSAQAGTIYETTTRHLGGGQEELTKLLVQDGKLRVEHSGTGSENVMIYKDDALHVLNPKDKSFVRMDRASIKQFADQVNPALKQMEEQLKNMTPEQRAMVEKMMGTQLPQGQAPATEVIKTSRKDKIAGLSCTYSEVRRAGVLEQELCLAPPSSLVGGQEMFDVAKKMSALMEEMLASLQSPMLRKSLGEQVEPYAKLDGFPVFSRFYQGGKPASETTLKSMRSENIAASQFDVPADYKRKEMIPK